MSVGRCRKVFGRMVLTYEGIEEIHRRSSWLGVYNSRVDSPWL